MSAQDSGPYAGLAKAARKKREASLSEGQPLANSNAVALTAIAKDCGALIRRVREIDGTYCIWTRLYGAQAEAEALAQEWERRSQETR